MVYGYEANEEFIDKTQQLLDKLDKKGIWNKNTLIVALDKSVRPLAYTLGKLSRLEGKETPDIKFFNYDNSEYYKGLKLHSNSYLKSLENSYKRKININSKYKKILVLDDYAATKNTLKNTKNLLQELINNKLKPKIYFATLSSSEEASRNGEEIISTEVKGDSMMASSNETGIVDYPEVFSKSERIRNKEFYNHFIKNRTQLRSDIIKYVKENNFGNEKQGSLEKKLLGTGAIVGFAFSLFFLSSNITGNAIGNLDSASNSFAGFLIMGVSFLLGFLALKK